MSRLSALVLVGLLGSLALMTQASLAQKSESYPPFPPLPQPGMPPLPGEPEIGKRAIVRVREVFLGEPNCGPIGVSARMLGQLDSLPSRIVQLDLKNTNSVAIISERITFHGVATKDESSPTLQQAYARKAYAKTLDSLLTGFTDVTHIEVNSVTYADGTSWQPVDGQACIVTPRSL
jgi:hypothetical protein